MQRTYPFHCWTRGLSFKREEQNRQKDNGHRRKSSCNAELSEALQDLSFLSHSANLICRYLKKKKKSTNLKTLLENYLIYY